MEPVDDAGRRVDASPRDGAMPSTDAPSDDASGRDDASSPADAGTPPSTWSRRPWEDCEGDGRTLEAGPDDYRTVLDTLMPGDTLRLRAGEYLRGLPMRVSGEEGRCIVVEALDPGARPLFVGSDSFNVLAIHGASWIKLRGLDVDIRGRAGFGVASQGGTEQPTDHVVIEGLRIFGFGSDQQIVGISTKSPATDWVIRGNRIEGPGTGLYLGNSDGRQPFVRGLIEYNTVVDAIGYCMQIKHQIERPAGLPDRAETVVRHNVFAKTAGASIGGNARPNLLFGHFPTSGAGAEDRYVIFGNLLYDNATENLLQAEGNLAIYSNVFVNPSGGAIAIQPHNDVPREVDVAFNTIVAFGRGLSIRGGNTAFEQRARYNTIFAATPLDATDVTGNVVGSLDDAARLLVDPRAAAGEGLDPRPRDLSEVAVEVSDLPSEAMRDFDGHVRGAVAGAFATTTGPALTLEAPPVPE